MTPRAATQTHTDPSQTLKVIGLMVLATVCFATLDTTAKYLVGTQGVPVSQVVWLRFAGHAVFSAVVLWPFALRPSLRSVKPLIQVIRSGFMILTTALNFTALRYLQLDQTIMIFFLMPLLVAALAGPLLGERRSASPLGNGRRRGGCGSCSPRSASGAASGIGS